jgi:N-acetyl-beta-hexosaminidase
LRPELRKKIVVAVLLLTVSLPVLVFAKPATNNNAKSIAILPTPASMHVFPGTFSLNDQTRIIYKIGSEKDTAEYLASTINNYTGFDLKASEVKNVKSRPDSIIILSLVPTINNMPDESYQLTVTQNKVAIFASTPAGLFYGMQTLLQLFDPDFFQKKTANREWEIPCVMIKDRPKHEWRSFMLDSGRQYQGVEFIKNLIDQLAMLKFNVFHWHLTEGQGWRIEIKKYPKLTEIGSKVATGPEQQGFYTQDEIRDIVAYARQRNITVMPEIDIPGHSEAALIAYPEMTCFRKAPESVMSFSPNLFCGGREETYRFLEDIFDEVCELFDSEYIHIGGDEAPKKNWNKCPDCQGRIKELGLKNSHELQIYFTNRIAKHLAKKNRKVVCWADVVTTPGPKLADNVVVYWWNWRHNKHKGLNEGARLGHKVICGTNHNTYLNFPLAPWRKYKKNRTFDIRMAYEQNPADVKNPTEEQQKAILGMGCCLWTDWNLTEEMLEGRIYPRVYALTEQMWYVGERLPFDDFYKKVKAQYPRLKAMGIDIGPAFANEIKNKSE